jgi:hypothetical protein
MVTVEYTNDQRSQHVGTQGEGRHVKSNDLSGTATVRLSDYSPSNDALMLIHRADTPLPLVITDKTTNAGLFFAASTVVNRVPNMVKSNEASMNEWILGFIKGEINHSGSKEISS